MDALMAALAAGLLATAPDRAALLVALSPHPRRAIALAAASTTAMAIVSVAFGIAIAPRLAPSARLLMLAVALAVFGAEFLLRRLAVSPPGRLTVAVTGSGLWFVVLALAMRSDVPWLAAPGAIVGTVVPLAAAAALGSEWRRLPLAGIRRAVGALALAAGAIFACIAIGIA